MADDQTISDGLSGSFKVSADEVPGSFARVQRVKLSYSADGIETHVFADVLGLKVQLGAALPTGTNAIGKLAANSGVDIGDVTLTAGTAAIGKLAANSGVDIGDVTINTGTAEIGKVEISDGSTQAEVTASGTNKALYTAIVDGSGDQVSLGASARITPTAPTLSITPAYGANDSLFTAALAFAGASASGAIVGITIIDTNNVTHDGTNGHLLIDLWRSSVTPGTANAAYVGAADDTEALTHLMRYDTSSDATLTTFGTTAKSLYVPVSPPLHYSTADSDTLYLTAAAKRIFSGVVANLSLTFSLDVYPG